MSLNIIVRVIGMLLFGTAGFYLCYYLAPTLESFNELVLPLTLLGALFGLLAAPYATIYPFRWIRNRLKNMPAQDLVLVVLGLFVGLLLGALLAWPLSTLPGWLGETAPTVGALLLAFLGVYAGVLRKRDLVEIFRSGYRSESLQSSGGNTGRLPRLESLSYPSGNLQSGFLDN